MKIKHFEYHYKVVYKVEATNTNANAWSRINEVMVIKKKSRVQSEHSVISLRSFEEFKTMAQTILNSEVHEIKEDLFEALDKFHLADCVSSDIKLSLGIALEFRRRYGYLRTRVVHGPVCQFGPNKTGQDHAVV